MSGAEAEELQEPCLVVTGVLFFLLICDTPKIAHLVSTKVSWFGGQHGLLVLVRITTTISFHLGFIQEIAFPLISAIEGSYQRSRDLRKRTPVN